MNASARAADRPGRASGGARCQAVATLAVAVEACRRAASLVPGAARAVGVAHVAAAAAAELGLIAPLWAGAPTQKSWRLPLERLQLVAGSEGLDLDPARVDAHASSR